MICRYVSWVNALDLASLMSMKDVLAHSQLAAAISYTPLHASLHSKQHIECMLDVVNQ
jgi:hypothetical protein